MKWAALGLMGLTLAGCTPIGVGVAATKAATQATTATVKVTAKAVL